MLKTRDVQTWLVVGALAIMASAAALIATSHGAGMSPDSVVYVSTARNLASEKGLVAFDGSVLTSFPPGYPTVLAIGEFLRVDPVTGARFANAAAFPMIVLLSYALISRHVESRAVAITSATIVATSPVLLEISASAWSDPLFAVVVLAWILTMERLLTRPNAGAVDMFVAVAFVWIAFLLRYAGATLLAAGIVILLIEGRREPLRAVRQVLVYLLLGIVVPVAWVVRNLLEGFGAFGDRYRASTNLGQNVKAALDVVSEWLLPTTVPVSVRAVFLAIAAGVAIASIWRRARVDVDATRQLKGLIAVTVFVVTYLMYLVISASITAIDPLDHRLLSPVFVPLVVIGASTVDVLVTSSGSRRWVVLLRAGGGLMVALWLLYPLSTSLKEAVHQARHGSGYASDDWESSALARRITGLPSTDRVYSNDASAVYFVAGRDAVRPSPARRAYQSDERLDQVPNLLNDLRCDGPAYLAWFTRDATPEPLTPPELRDQGVDLTVIDRTADGLLFSIRSSDTHGRGACSQ